MLCYVYLVPEFSFYQTIQNKLIIESSIFQNFKGYLCFVYSKWEIISDKIAIQLKILI